MNVRNRTEVEPKEIVKEFIAEKLEGEPTRLLDFDFYRELEYDRTSPDYKYSEMTTLNKVEERDPDDYQIVRAIMYLIWRKKLPQLTFEDIGTGRKYRGETLNTYRTLLGHGITVQNKYGFDERLIEKVEAFRKLYLTIGNFMLLPNGSVDVFTPCKENKPKSASFNMNTWRGTACGPRWFDYFDQFLIELDKCFKKQRDRNDVLSHLFEKNDFYFNESNIKDLTDFVKINFLTGYLDNNDEVVHRFPEKLYHWYWRTPSEANCQVYRDFTDRFIDESSKIIQDRAKVMLSELLEAL